MGSIPIAIALYIALGIAFYISHGWLGVATAILSTIAVTALLMFLQYRFGRIE